MAKSAAGNGSIRKKEKTVNGKKYTWWEARFSLGFDPVTGKQKQKTITGKTQKEVAKKLKDATQAVDAGTYIEPDKTTASAWMKTWVDDYCNRVAPTTKELYRTQINKHIIPGLGIVPLSKLTTNHIQKMYNSFLEEGLSPKTVKNIHGVLHKALDQAKRERKIPDNPSDYVDLPKITKAQIKPLEPSAIMDYLSAAQEDDYCNLLTVAVFSGMRQGEILGLSWKDVDFKNGSIYVCQQLQRVNKEYIIKEPKWESCRTLFPAKVVMDALRAEKAAQHRRQLENIEVWDNPFNLVFTDDTGKNLVRRTVDKHHEKVLERAGIPHARFHDLRHSYAVVSLMAGDDVKTLQVNLGHSNSQTTLDTYSHVIDQMKRNSSDRLQAFYESQKKSRKGEKKGERNIG